MFSEDLPEFPFPLYENKDGSITWGDADNEYVRSPVYDGVIICGYKYLHPDEVAFLSPGYGDNFDDLRLGSEVSVEFIYLLGRGI